MSNHIAQRSGIPEIIEAKRTDPVYMAHSYLTKVPVTAIIPFIEAFTSPGDIVLDPFAGSGMTGVAAAATSRQARLFDVSVLGRHVGTNYVNLVDSDQLRKRASEAMLAVTEKVGDIYSVGCQACGRNARLVKTIWSVVVACAACDSPVIFYEALKAAGWDKRRMQCPHCHEALSPKARRIAEAPVIDSIACQCSATQLEQRWTPALEEARLDGIEYPDVPIGEDRQMYVASALGKHGLTSTAAFYSPRNLAVLGALKGELESVEEQNLRAKLRFAFTAILTRASKRYQWSRQRPLNAANANYYVAPVFYEWNVFDLFNRKVEAAIRSDDWICERRGSGTLFAHENALDISYETASADALPLPDHCVDYVFMDPPFGSNIFYSDMNIFQEAWLDDRTDPAFEAVVDRVDLGMERTAERYQRLLADAFLECRRVLKPGGVITIVFGNSSGRMWGLLQQAIAQAQLEVDPELVTVLDKGQRSVKGLASGFENVATLDLVLTMRPTGFPPKELRPPALRDVDSVVDKLIRTNGGLTPSHIYVELLKNGFESGWDLSSLELRHVTERLRAAEHDIDRKTGRVSSNGWPS